MRFPDAEISTVTRYVIAKLRDIKDDIIYRTYVTNCLRLITENTAKYAGGSYMKIHYSDMIAEKKPQPEKSAEEIIAEVTKNAGLEVI